MRSIIALIALFLTLTMALPHELQTRRRAFDVASIGNTRERGHDRRTDGHSHQDRRVPDGDPRNPPRAAPWEDSCLALEVIQHYDRFTRVQILANDRICQVLQLSPEDELNRQFFLASYRTSNYLTHLSEGRFDENSEAANNQEYDGYLYDLRHRISAASTSVVIALRTRNDPQPPLRMALTVPPAYEPSDLPTYTATIAPPEYSLETPRGHTSRDAPPCLAADCPVVRSGIGHSCGVYHHNGQVGPMTIPKGVRLPSFGPSNPPPEVWKSYNRMVLGIASQVQVDMIESFIRYHGPSPRSSRPPPLLVRNADIPEYMEQLLPHGTNQGRMSRIPSPATGNEDPVKRENSDDGVYVDSMRHYTHLQVHPRRHYQLPRTQSLLGPEPWDPERLPIISSAARHPSNNRAAGYEHLQPDRQTGHQRNLHQPSTRRIERGAASLVPEPLRIPRRRRASIFSSNNVRLSRDPSVSEPSHYRASERHRPACRVSARPVLADPTRSPNALLEVPRRPDGYAPIANMYSQTTQSHRSQSRRPERRRNRHQNSTAPNDRGVHLLRQPFYSHLYNIDRRTVRQRLATTRISAAPRLRVSAIIHPSASTETSTEPAPTRLHTPYPRAPPDLSDTADLHVDNGGGILGTFNWETNVENVDDERLLAILAGADDALADENNDTMAAEELLDNDMMTDETMFERFASWGQASYYLI
ncbi:MAG: hypothetical protein Q9184_001394 [Pyrenodesmia sp. 2 TL-2023]